METRFPMSCVDVRVREEVIDVPVDILPLVMEFETARFVPLVKTLLTDLISLRLEVLTLCTELEDLSEQMARCQSDVDLLLEDTTPLWDDTYRLCGDPDCDGGCRVCQEEEAFLEDEATEKYCRRGRR
jgi:hypothetical protein